MIYTLKIYRLDRRCKTGERYVASCEFDCKDDDAMNAVVIKRRYIYPSSDYRLEYAPKFITVKNMMNGKDVQIAADTPWNCRPDSESYWSA